MLTFPLISSLRTRFLANLGHLTLSYSGQYGLAVTEEYRRGAEVLRDKIARYHPKVVCYVGKGVYEQLSGRKGMDWGKQDEPVVPGVIDFVAPSSSGLVRMPLADIISIYAQLKAWIS